MTPSPTRDSIINALEHHREHIRRLGVRRLGLFGSAARGENTSRSDLDFLVEFEHKSFDSYMDVKDFLEQIFSRPADLVITEALKPRLREAILRETVHAQGL
jgi:predicted nucleotidyltransferase